MASRELVYSVKIETSQARQQAQAMRAAFENELKQIKVGALDSSGLSSFNGQAQQAAQGYGTLAQGADKLKKSNEGVAGSLADLITGYLSFRGAQAALQGLQQIDTLGTQATRTAFAFEELSGGANQAATNVLAIQRAGAGTIGALTAMSTGTTALTLNLADTAAEFGEIASAARAVTVVSPVINDVSSAISELGIAAANLSYRRLDQLGLSVGDVRDRIGELTRENDGLDESAAFLEATVGLLNEKYGDLVTSAEAAATGQERLTVAFAEFGRLIATTDVVRGTTEGFFGDWAGVLEAANVTFFGIEAGAYAVEKTLEGFAKTATDAFMPDAGRINAASEIIKEINNAAIEGKPGIEGYQQQALEVAAAIVRWGSASEQQIKQLREIQALTAGLGTPSDPNSFLPFNSVSAIQAQQAAEEQRAGGIYEQQGGINESLTGAAQKSIDNIGLENALTLLKEQKALVDQAITELVADATIVNPDEIALRIAEIQQTATQAFADAAAAMPEVDAETTAASFGILGQALTDLNQGFVDFLPSTAALRDELIALSDEIAYTGVTTEEQAAQLEYLSEAAAAVGNEQSLLTAVTDQLGIAFLSSNEAAAATVDAMYQAQAAYMAGQLTAVQYAGVMSALGGQLLALASDAGVATSAILALNAAQGGAASLPGFSQGQQIGGGIAQRIQTQQAQRDREAERRAAERARAEAERAAKRAAAEAERGAKRAGKALEDGAKKAAQNLQSALKSVPGLFGRSAVTEEQMTKAKSGLPQNFADDFLRRAEDEIKNGVDWAEVDIADIARRVGLDPSLPAEIIFNELVAQWESGAFFADEANLELINKEAVQAALDMQEKARQGQENIMKLFGASIDGAVEAVGAGIVAGGGVATGGGAYTIPISASLVPMTAGADEAAGGGTFAITPTIDTQAIQAQLTDLELSIALSESAGTNLVVALGQQIGENSLAFLAQGQAIGGVMSAGAVTGFGSAGTNFVMETGRQIGEQVAAFGALGQAIGSTIAGGASTGFDAANTGQALVTAIATDIAAQSQFFLAQGQAVGAIVKGGIASTFSAASGGGEGGQPQADFAMGLVAALNSQFDANANFFYAAGQGPANTVLNGYRSAITGGDVELVTPMITTINTQIRGNTEGFRNQGATMAQYVQNGFVNGFSAESFKATLLSIGESMGVYLQAGVLSVFKGGELIEAIGAKVLADLSTEVEAN